MLYTTGKHTIVVKLMFCRNKACCSLEILQVLGKKSLVDPGQIKTYLKSLAILYMAFFSSSVQFGCFFLNLRPSLLYSGSDSVSEGIQMYFLVADTRLGIAAGS